MAPLPVLSLFSCGHMLECTVLVLAHALIGLAMAPYQYLPWVGEAPLWWKMYLIACGVVVGFVDHAGVYILKLCPCCSLDLQDKIKQMPVLSLVGGNVFYFSSLGEQLGAVMAWEMFGVIFVVFIIIPPLSYTAFQKRKAADADGYLSMSEENAPTPKNSKHFAMDSATAVRDPDSTGMPSSHAQFPVAYTYIPFVPAH